VPSLGHSYAPVQCSIDGYVYFYWHAESHDLQLMASSAAYDACDFTGAIAVQPTNAPANSQGFASYYLPCTAAPGSVLYLSCSVSDHCADGQKLAVHISRTAHAIDSSTEPPTALLHSDSLSRVMTLLGHRVDGSTGYSYLDRGYQTDESAEVSLEMVWCLSAHCPDSALDFDDSASEASCLAQVYNLGGFISRKRPTPDYAHAESYYLTALEHEPTHCPTLSYLSELYLQTSNASAATATALRLCAACGSGSAAAGQAKAAFDASMPAVAAWPCVLTSPPSPPLQPGEALMFTVTTALTLDGTVETFDTDAFRTRFAAASEVEASAVSISTSSGSIVVTATVTTPDASSAASVAQRISAVVADPAAASDSLGVVVVSIAQAPVVASVTLSAEEVVQMQAAASSSSTTPAIIGGVVGGVVLLAAYVACRMRAGAPSTKSSSKQEVHLATALSKTSKAPSKHTELGVDVDHTPSTADQVPSLPPSPPSSRKGSARVAPVVV